MTTRPATDDQRLALEQLRRTAALSGGRLVILGEQGPDEDGVVWVHVTLSLEGMQTRSGGLPLRQREPFRIGIPPTFPFEPPAVHIAHSRWAGTAHVVFADLLCLYLAPAVEWNPADSMHGLLDRLDFWLRQAAVGALDPVGMPVHPPVTYPLALDTPLVIRATTSARSPTRAWSSPSSNSPNPAAWTWSAGSGPQPASPHRSRWRR